MGNSGARFSTGRIEVLTAKNFDPTIFLYTSHVDDILHDCSLSNHGKYAK